MTLEMATEQFLKRFEATDDINDRQLVRLQREVRNALASHNTEMAALRERLQLAESRAACGDAFASAMLDEDDSLAAAFIGGMGALVEARS